MYEKIEEEKEMYQELQPIEMPGWEQISGKDGCSLRRLMRASLLASCLVAMGSVAVHAQSYTYVTNTDDDTLSVMYTATHEIKNPPIRAIISLRPDGLSPLDRLNPVATAITPYSIAGNAQGQFVYTVNKTAGTVSVVDVAKSKLIKTIDLKTEPTDTPMPVAIAISGVRLNPLGGQCRAPNPLWRTFAYVTNAASNSVSIIDTDPKSTTWNQVVKTLTVGQGASAVAVSKPTLEQAANGMYFAGGFYIFVTNSLDGTVSVINGDYRASSTNQCGGAAPGVNFHTVIKTLDLKPMEGLTPNPTAIAFDRYARWAYVANTGSDTVTAIDACFDSDHNGGGCDNPFKPNYKVVKTIHLNTDGTRRSGARPSGMAITIDFTGSHKHEQFRAYVPNSGDDSYSVLDVEPGSPNFQTTVFTCEKDTLACPKTGDKPSVVTIVYPDEDFAYMTNNGSNSVMVIDTDPDSLGGPGGVLQYNHEVGRVTRGIGTPDPLGQDRIWKGHPLGIANTPRVPYAYVMNSGSGSISVVGASPQIGDPHPVLATIDLTFNPNWVTLNRNQDFIFVGDPAGGKVHVINTIGQVEVGATYEAMGKPLRLATPPDGWSAYVTSDNGSVYTVDTVDRAGPGGPGDPFVAGGGDDVTYPIPGSPDFAQMIVRLRQCPRANPVPPCAGQVAGGGLGSGEGGTGEAGGGGGTPPPPAPGSEPYRIKLGSGGLGGLDVHPDTFIGLVAKKTTNQVLMIDTHYDSDTWNKKVGSVSLPPGSKPVAVAFTHVGSRALVMNENTSAILGGFGTVSLLDTSTDSYSLINTIAVGRYPMAVAFNEDDLEAYVTNQGDRTVSVIRMSDFTVLSPPAGSPVMPANGTVKVGKTPTDIFINLGERTAAYVTNKGDGTVSIIDVQDGNPTFNKVLATVKLVNVNNTPLPTAELAPVGVIITEP